MSEHDGSDDVCVYCGSPEALTNDHIPPKCLFPEPRPSNLITVRSCQSCNMGASKDDEYFRLRISMLYGMFDHPAVKRILPAVYRSLQKPRKNRYRQTLLREMHDLDVFSPGGIYLGTAGACEVDLGRLESVARRITTGLYFHEFRSRVPGNREVVALSAFRFTDINQEAAKRVVNFCGMVRRNAPKIIGDNVFAYSFRQFQNDPTGSAWVLAFYKKVVFLCLVMRRKRADVGPKS